MRAYLDASVLVPLLRTEPRSQDARRFLSDSSNELVLSEFGRGEVAAAMARLVRMGELDEVAAHRLLAGLDTWLAATVDLVATFEPEIRHAAQLVRRFELQLRMPDAIHLASCLAFRARLATFDRGMATAAVALGIEIVKLAPKA